MKDQDSGKKEKELSPAQKFTVARKREEELLLETIYEKFFYKRRKCMDEHLSEDRTLEILKNEKVIFFPDCREASPFDTPAIKRAIKSCNKRRLELFDKAIEEFWENRSRIDY